MGNKFSESSKEAKTVAYKVVKGDNNTPRIDVDGRLYTPQELSAMILQKMKNSRGLPWTRRERGSYHCPSVF